ncbi:MAG: diguanylate cyclase and metal dependent phosphohydrolase [Cyanobacteria bacterium RYN_339]|nr:diguanylate cyclase and metal dependent phosphohydrolase [Cyanobacteria bacterium RYN_339]
MIERPPALAKLLPLLAADGRLADAVRGAWAPLAKGLGDRLALDRRDLDAMCADGLAALEGWSIQRNEGQNGRAPLQQWLLRLRQDVSLEGLLLVLVQLDRAQRQGSWQLGLPAPDWLALGELTSQFFEAVFEEAAAGWQGLLAQNHQLRDELSYFHRLAASLETGQPLVEHLQLAVRETARLLHCEFCAILLPVEGQRDVLSIRAAVAPKILSNALDGMPFPLSENGLIAQVFLTGAPASTYQPLEDLEITMRRRQTLESLGFSQLMAYPLQTHGRVLGVLCVANRLDDQPWQALEEEWLSTVAGQLSASIRLSQLYVRQENTEEELARALTNVMAQKDPQLSRHGEEVGRLAREIGGMLGIMGPRQDGLALAGQLHDLGLLFVPDVVRLRPGALRPADMDQIRRHPVAGAALLASFKPLEALASAVRHHHENWDGSGYPDGLKGQDIPLEARILAVADCYHTLTTPQTYQRSVSRAEALEELGRVAGTQLDPLAVQAIVQVLAVADPEPAAAGTLLPPPAFLAPIGLEPVALVRAAPAHAAEVPDQAPRLMGMLAELLAAPDPTDFGEKFWACLTAACALDASAIWRASGVAKLELANAFGWNDHPSGDQVPETGLETYVAACQVPVAAADLAQDPRFHMPEAMSREGFVSAMALPLVAGEHLLGVLTVYRRVDAPFTPSEQGVLDLAAAMLAQGLEALDLRARHQTLLETDALTGAANHRAFAERLATELKRSERFELPLAAFLVDLDGFAAYNEAHGYMLGDEALKQVAELVTARVGPSGLVARFDADGLAVLLPETGAADAMLLGDEVRTAIAASLFPGRQAGGARLTACVGVTARTAGAASRQAFLADLRTACDKAANDGPNRLLFHASAVAEEVERG